MLFECRRPCGLRSEEPASDGYLFRGLDHSVRSLKMSNSVVAETDMPARRSGVSACRHGRLCDDEVYFIKGDARDHGRPRSVEELLIRFAQGVLVYEAGDTKCRVMLWMQSLPAGLLIPPYRKLLAGTEQHPGFP